MELGILKKIVNFESPSGSALCTQIKWSGSVPRKDYPMMLVDNKNRIIGTVGGGALENSVIQLAQNVIKDGIPLVKYFDLTNQDISKSGSICGGKTSILIEPFSADIRNIYRQLLDDKFIFNNLLITEINIAENVIVSRKQITKDYHLVFAKSVVKTIDSAIEQKCSKSLQIKNQIYLIQYVGTRPKLHIFGAGHVGQAVAEAAHFVEMDVDIYDERKDLASKTRFPFATNIIRAEIGELIKNITISKTDFALVATRGHQHDYALMRWLLNLNLEYLGLMSSQKKWQLLSQALVNDGFSEEKLATVFSPVGFDIGSETVPEIAISIMAELINQYQNKSISKQSLSKS